MVNIMIPLYVTQYLEELDFLHEVCLTAISNRFVKFAAVLDNNGKLIIAEYKKGIQNNWLTDSVPDSRSSHDSSYLFHLDYLVPAVSKRRPCWSGSMEEEIHFEIIEIDANVRLAVASLTEGKDKYLCLYVDSSAPNREIISKLRNAII